METKHYKEELSAYVNGELLADVQTAIRDHVAECSDCRTAYDEIALGSRLATQFKQVDASDAVWTNVVDGLDGGAPGSFGLIPSSSTFGLRKGFASAVALVAVAGLATVVFLNLFGGESPYQAVKTNRNGATANPGPTISPTNENTQSDANTNVNANTNIATPTADGFNVETLAGTPTIEGGSDRIGVGGFLETDARSTARIAVADIGTVDVSPNSRIRLEETGKSEHRLSLERGKLHAKIFAPPRLFVVDTPSAKAVDLGCEYTLDVDKNGDSVLHVTGGWVALERGGRESLVPAGMMCKTRKGQGLGTPFSTEASETFKKALDNFDFSRGGSTAVQTMVREAEFYDMFTLWHLLSRVAKEDRGVVYDALANLVPPPAGVTREGILSKNKKMLDAWKVEVENAWFS
ncbi:MAG: FecR domain-containing protein [Pyrinomonadaceae bacterium]